MNSCFSSFYREPPLSFLATGSLLLLRRWGQHLSSFESSWHQRKLRCQSTGADTQTGILVVRNAEAAAGNTREVLLSS